MSVVDQSTVRPRQARQQQRGDRQSRRRLRGGRTVQPDVIIRRGDEARLSRLQQDDDDDDDDDGPSISSRRDGRYLISCCV